LDATLFDVVIAASVCVHWDVDETDRCVVASIRGTPPAHSTDTHAMEVESHGAMLGRGRTSQQLQLGDVLVAVGGTAVASPEHAQALLDQLSFGDVVVRVMRPRPGPLNCDGEANREGGSGEATLASPPPVDLDELYALVSDCFTFAQECLTSGQYVPALQCAVHARTALAALAAASGWHRPHDTRRVHHPSSSAPSLPAAAGAMGEEQGPGRQNLNREASDDSSACTTASSNSGDSDRQSHGSTTATTSSGGGEGEARSPRDEVDEDQEEEDEDAISSSVVAAERGCSMLLGLIYDRVGMPSRAAAELGMAIELGAHLEADPMLWEEQFRLLLDISRCHRVLNKPEEALQYATRALDMARTLPADCPETGDPLGCAYEARALVATAQVLRRDRVRCEESLRREESLILRLRNLAIRSAGTPEAAAWDLQHLVSRAAARCLLLAATPDPRANTPALLEYDKEVFEMYRMVSTTYGGTNVEKYVAQIAVEFYATASTYLSVRLYVAAAVACKEREVRTLQQIERPSMPYARALWSLASLLLRHPAPHPEGKCAWRQTPEVFFEHVHGAPLPGDRRDGLPRDDWRDRAKQARLAAAAEFAAVGGNSCKAARVARAAVAAM
jgi:tetratricopeptide (TPR) repeat protein